jgi:hypothetical protein
MIDTRSGFSTSTVDFANETLSYCIQHLLITWFRLPLTVPEDEVLELRKDMQRVIEALLVDLESTMPGLHDRLVLDMRGLADLVAELVAPCETSDPVADAPALKLVFSEADSTLPIFNSSRAQ